MWRARSVWASLATFDAGEVRSSCKYDLKKESVGWNATSPDIEELERPTGRELSEIQVRMRKRIE
jgi:hypothetical protein